MLALLIFGPLFVTGLTCLLVGHFLHEPVAKKCSVWLLCATPLSLLLFWWD